MTVQKDVTKNIYVGNGSTRTFPFTFECPAEHPEYIKVYLMQDDGTALATSDYQLDMDARQITYPSSGAALPEGKKLVIMRELPLQQMMNLVNNGPYFAEDVELAFDENVMAMQQIAEKLNRSIIMSVDIDGDAFVNEVPFEAGKSFRIADDGKSIVLTEDPARVLPLAQGVYAQAQAQAQSAYASAAAAAQSEDSAAASQSAAATSATNAEASENAAKTSETNAKSSETAARNSATSAASSASTASTQAGKAADSATAAAGSATQAGTFATTATNKATAADKSATAAAASAITASDKASEAATSATNAAVSATSAAGAAEEAQGLISKAEYGFLERNKKYAVGDIAYTTQLPAGYYLECVTAGTTSNTEPSISVESENVNDGTVKWGVKNIQDTSKLGLPVGFEAFTTNPNLQAGWLPLLGGEYSRTAYADLWAWVQTQQGYLIEESAWQAKAAANSGNVPFYSKGNGSTTFRVPALKCWVRGAGSISEVGGYLPAGLPNITGSTAWAVNGTLGIYSAQGTPYHQNTGALSVETDGKAYGAIGSTGDDSAKSNVSVNIDASLSTPIYGSSDTVQPPSIVGLWCVKAYDTVTNVGSTDVSNIASGLTSLETRFSTDITPIRLGGTGATTAYDARRNLGVDVDVFLADATLLWQNPKPTSSFTANSIVLSQPYTNFKRLLFIASKVVDGYTYVSAAFINVDVLSANIELVRNNSWTYVAYMVGTGGSGIYGDVSKITTTELHYSTNSLLRPQFIYGYK